MQTWDRRILGRQLAQEHVHTPPLEQGARLLLLLLLGALLGLLLLLLVFTKVPPVSQARVISRVLSRLLKRLLEVADPGEDARVEDGAQVGRLHNSDLRDSHEYIKKQVWGERVYNKAA